MSVFVRQETEVFTCGMSRCKQPATARVEDWDRGVFYGSTHLCPEHLAFALGKSSVVQS